MTILAVSQGRKPADPDDGLSIVVSPNAPATCWLVLFTNVGTADVRMEPNEFLLQYAFPDVVGNPYQSVRCNATGDGIDAEPKFQSLVDAATVVWDAALGRFADVVLDGNRILDKPTNLQAGDTFLLAVIQDAVTGSRLLTYHADYLFAGGTPPTLSTGVGAIDLMSFAVIDVSGTLKMLFTGILKDYS